MGEITGYFSMPGMEADEDLSAHQYKGVVLASTNFRVAKVTNANGERPIGILQDDPANAGDPADVAIFGMCKAEYGGTISVGAKLAMNNAGEVISDVEVADGGAVDLHHIGIALVAGSDGDIERIYLMNAQRIGSE